MARINRVIARTTSSNTQPRAKQWQCIEVIAFWLSKTPASATCPTASHEAIIRKVSAYLTLWQCSVKQKAISHVAFWLY